MTIIADKNEILRNNLMGMINDMTAVRKSILYISDCESNFDTAKATIKNDLNADLFSAKNYDEALEATKCIMFDMIIIDTNKPDDITLEFLHKVPFNLTTRIPVVILNNENADDLTQYYIENSFIDLFAKPFSLDNFISKIKYVLH